MRNIRLFQCLLVLICLNWSCGSPLKVTSDFDKDANFSKYKTFSIYKSENIHDNISELNQKRILDAIRAEMVKKGFNESPDAPDLLVNTVAIMKDRMSVSSTSNVYGYGGVYRPYYWGGAGMSATTNYNVYHYKDGSLIIDVIDAGTKELVWQGIGNKEIDKPIKNPDTNIPKAIGMIMEKFPPGNGKKK